MKAGNVSILSGIWKEGNSSILAGTTVEVTEGIVSTYKQFGINFENTGDQLLLAHDYSWDDSEHDPILLSFVPDHSFKKFRLSMPGRQAELNTEIWYYIIKYWTPHRYNTEAPTWGNVCQDVTHRRFKPHLPSGHGIVFESFSTLVLRLLLPIEHELEYETIPIFLFWPSKKSPYLDLHHMFSTVPENRLLSLCEL